MTNEQYDLQEKCKKLINDNVLFGIHDIFLELDDTIKENLSKDVYQKTAILYSVPNKLFAIRSQVQRHFHNTII